MSGWQVSTAGTLLISLGIGVAAALILLATWRR